MQNTKQNIVVSLVTSLSLFIMTQKPQLFTLPSLLPWILFPLVTNIWSSYTCSTQISLSLWYSLLPQLIINQKEIFFHVEFFRVFIAYILKSSLFQKSYGSNRIILKKNFLWKSKWNVLGQRKINCLAHSIQPVI